jgi:hypothetical protein
MIVRRAGIEHNNPNPRDMCKYLGIGVEFASPFLFPSSNSRTHRVLCSTPHIAELEDPYHLYSTLTN